jgi:hypothetical protein
VEIKMGTNRLGKISHRRMEEHGKKLRRSWGKTQIDGEAWLLDDPHKM